MSTSSSARFVGSGARAARTATSYGQGPISPQGPDPLEQFWLSVSLPDGLYVAPPDLAAQPDSAAARSAARTLIAGVGLAVGLLAALITLAAF